MIDVKRNTMTKQQITALSDPCELAQQCANQKYRTMKRQGKTILSGLLTVNVGEE